jgi:hypothetical protein
MTTTFIAMTTPTAATVATSAVRARPSAATVVCRPNLARSVAAVVLLATLAGCLWMYTRHNAFPLTYHPDEGGKVMQVLSASERRNFNHPQLLLEATEWAVYLLDTPRDPQAVVVVGRTVSGVFSALAVVALALCGYLVAGLPGLLAVTPVVALCPFLLAYSHAMKEDAALAFGVAISVLGARLMWDWGQRPLLQWLAVVALALGVALAVSAKYVGAVAVVVAIPALLFAPRQSLLAAMLRPVVFLSWLFLFVVTINHRAINHFDAFTSGLEREYEHSQNDHLGLTMDKPNLFAFDTARDQTAPPARWLLVAGGLVASIWWWRGYGAGWDRAVWLFAITFLIVLSYGVIPMARYALPVVVLAALLAGVGAARLGQLTGWTWARWGVPAAFAIATCAWQGPLCVDYVRQFGDDSRQNLRTFILKEPSMEGASILAENYTALGGPAYDGADDGLRRRARIDERMFAGNVGSLENARRMGYTHIAIADFAYGRFFDKHAFPVRDATQWYRQQYLFYHRLFKEGQLVWSHEPKHPSGGYTNPTIRLYAIGR